MPVISPKEYLSRGQTLLAAIQAQKIETFENTSNLTQYKSRVELLRSIAMPEGIPAQGKTPSPLPGMTACVAVAMLKAGNCQELCQLAALFYLAAGWSDITLLILGNSGKTGVVSDDHPNHLIILLGPVVFDEQLYPSESGRFASSRFYPKIKNFLSAQPASVVIVDPLLEFVGFAQGDNAPMHQYCEPRGIKNVIGLSLFNRTIGDFDPADIARIVKDTAIELAEDITEKIGGLELVAEAKRNNGARCVGLIKQLRINEQIQGPLDKDGMSVLHYACLYGNRDLFDAYMAAAPNRIHDRNKAGHTPLDCLGYGKAKIVEALKASGAPLKAEKSNEILVNVSALKSHLIAHGYYSDWLLRKEARDGNLESVKGLVGIAPDSINEVGMPSQWTALHQAASQGHQDVCLFLIQKQAKIDAIDKDGNTPLLLAAKGGHDELVKELIRAGANLKHVNGSCQSLATLLSEKPIVMKEVLEIVPRGQLMGGDYRLFSSEPSAINAENSAGLGLGSLTI